MWIEKLPKGKFAYRERYEDPYTGKLKIASITKTSKSNVAKKQAQKELKEKIESILQRVKTSDHTMEELLDEWWEFHQHTVRNNTKRDYINILNAIKRSKHINLKAKISLIDTQYFQRYLNTLAGKYSQAKKHKTALKLAFDHAIDMAYIKENPVLKAKIVKLPVTLETFVRVEDTYLEKTEVDLLLKQYYSTFQSIRTGYLIEFMYLTGMRIGEAISLQVKNYHKENGKLDIHGTLDYAFGYQGAEKEMTKTLASYREIDLSNRVIEILDKVIIENHLKIDGYDKESYIFIGKTGKPIQVNTLNNSLAYNNEKLGDQKIEKNLTSHIFRYSHISLLSELGVPIKAIMQRVGHSDEKTTLKIYTHVTNKQKTDIIEKLNNLGL